MQLVKKFPAFLEPEGSSPYSQVPATCPYPEPTPSSPHNPRPLPEDPYKIIIHLLYIPVREIIGIIQLIRRLPVFFHRESWPFLLLPSTVPHPPPFVSIPKAHCLQTFFPHHPAT